MSQRAWTYLAVGLVALLAVTFVSGWVLHDLNADRNVADSQTLAERLALIVGFSGFNIVGAFLISRRPEHAMGRLLCAVALLAAFAFAANEYATYALISAPGSLPAGRVAGWFASWLWYPAVILAVIYLPLLFPDGRLPSPRWRWLAYTTAIVLAAVCVSFALAPELDVGYSDDAPEIANPLAIRQIEGLLDTTLAVTFPIVVAAALLAALSVVRRFRGSRGDARQQIKWFAAGVLLLVLSLPASEISAIAGSIAFAGGLLAVPIAVAIAVLRYRLYDIDRIVSRTLVYGLLTAGLALTYFGLVVGLQAALRPVSGGSDFAIALTTLVVAALFFPARQRLQDAVDRRFNRRAYNAARTIEAFSARLREQVDLDTLRYELLAVVDETMQPARASLWLRARPETVTFSGRRSAIRGAP
jgi:hypothetical protein